MKTYTLDRDAVKNVNLSAYSPTIKGILKALFKMTKDEEGGFTGQQILEYAVEHKLWSTKQDPSRYMTTWAYYVKLLKAECHVLEVGTIKGNAVEEFLNEEEDETEE